jgi:glucose/arabinose dehydrogenase
VIVRGGDIPAWNGSFLIGTMGSEHLHRVSLNPDGSVAHHEVYFQNTYGRIREVTQSPGGAIYMTTTNCDSRGVCPAEQDQILRILPN